MYPKTNFLKSSCRSVRRNFNSAKFPTAKIPFGEISARRKSISAKIPSMKILLANIPVTKNTMVQKIWQQ